MLTTRSALLLAPCLACACSLPGGRQDAPGGERLTLDQTLPGPDGVSFGGELPDWSWAPDGERLLLVERGPEGPTRTLVDPLSGAAAGGSEALESADAEEAARLVRLAALEGVDAEQAARIAEEEVDAELEGRVRLFVHEGAHYVDDGQVARRLDAALDGELADLSPDGRSVVFVEANDLVLVDVESGVRTDLTHDGSENVFNGKLDWVYQEEIYGRYDFKGFWWSPDARHVAFLRLDESDVYAFTLVDHIEPGHHRVLPEVTKYPKAGDPNPEVGLGILSVEQVGEPRWVDLGAFAEEEPLVVRVLWEPGGERLLYMVQDRIQTWLELLAVGSDGAEPRSLLRETSVAWTNRAPAPHWLADGSFLWLSEATGQRHLERRAADGGLLATLTEGPWSVAGVLHVDEERGAVWFEGSRDGAVNRNVYRVSLDGAGLTRLTPGDGHHEVSFNAAHTLFLDRHSSLAEPPVLSLRDADGGLVRELARADMGAFERFATSRWELHEIAARDGYPLDVALLRPVDFRPQRSYPVWLFTYSGPNAPTVRNRWDTSVWHQFLAQNGVIVLKVNVRSASGKGLQSTALCYRQLGRQELQDIEDAVAWVTDNPWADAERVGMTGHSYGGFMTAFALTHSDRFALGIASSGVYDWRIYDTIYTERYMQTPQLNPEGYRATSVIEAAAGLRGHLIVTHGVMDDNVHFQNALALADALQRADKPFEFMVYPQARHGIRRPDQRRFARRIAWEAIQEHLLGRSLHH